MSFESADAEKACRDGLWIVVELEPQNNEIERFSSAN